jgi:hypothetical protein
MAAAAIELLNECIDAFLQHRGGLLSLSGAPVFLGKLLMCQSERDMFGKGFIIGPSNPAGSSRPSFTVVTNWFDEVRAKMGEAHG